MTPRAEPGILSLTSTSYSAQKALATPELLLLILGELDSGRALINAAQVCKSWAPLADDVRWRTRTVGLKRLLGTLTQYLGPAGDPWSDVKTLEDSIPETVWAEFQHLASRITRLHINATLTPTSLKILRTLLGRKPLCPQLIHCETSPYWLAHNDAALPADLIASIIPPTLRSFELSWYDGNDNLEEMVPIINAVARLTENLKDLHTISPDWYPDYTMFPKVKSVTATGWLDHEAWKALSTCTLLESICIFEGPDPEQGSPGRPETDQPYSVTFPKLKSFELRDDTHAQYPTFIRDIFRYSTMPLLEEVAFSSDPRIDRSAIRRYLRKKSPLVKKIDWGHHGVDVMEEWAERDANLGDPP